MTFPSHLPAEVSLIERLADGFGRSALQCNRRHESDAELVRIPGTSTVLAVTTDAISEEIESGLYADPYLIGWMTVLVNASDLAAVGAAPLGILLNQTLPTGMADGELDALQRGLREAAGACALPVLGGDTNAGPRLHMGACAIGLIAQGNLLTRIGAAPGDHLFASGPLGLGGAFAMARMTQPDGAAPPFRPQPRLAEGQLVRRHASCCMDTSDGAIATLDELSRLNEVGFLLRPVEELLHPTALAASRASGVPPWFLLAGPHGEFELAFTVPQTRLQAFRVDAARLGWEPLELGTVTRANKVLVATDNGRVPLDTRAVREAFGDAGGDIRRYRAALQLLNERMQPSSTLSSS
jgi:thiamine-monophosphate kinase